ncbi:hypothetical protein [Streptomyces sp. NBC_00572]|uniref:hypothetical protein n=1 Tax=Streptomyces sp. NBC_00572 TaxID=2903664 RepID=UPI00225ABF8F|nr:hypothetical protein [Streptomyces sp. NBC_00572]MCX4980494.1 hypothetical protein [Streptomyces sp. NBC_00572]
MSASDQDTQAAKSPEAPEADGTPEEISKAEETPAKTPRETSAETREETPEADELDEAAGDDEDDEHDEDDEDENEDDEEAAPGAGLTPKQARRLRVAAASVLLVAMAVVLVIRLASRTSVLVVGVYGLAMILCGIVIELSRNGRTRLGTWLLVGGLLAALALDWLVLP